TQKGVVSSSSAQKGTHIRRFGAKAMEEHGLKCSMPKRDKYTLENWIYKGRLVIEFPIIRDTVCELGLG
ncbi:hypothetical protein HAX54_012492, partial [Datura stramonium]|nr:hypothetical protein [Datura stramonium]